MEDATHDMQSEIVLTADTFIGPHGHTDGKDATECEVCLYDVAGKALGEGGVTKRLSVPAMHTTVLSAVNDAFAFTEKK